MKTFISKLISIKTFLVLLLLITLGVSGFLYWRYSESTSEINKLKSQTATNTENEEIVTAVTKLIELPADEKPSVATITDKEKLNDQPFFSKAVNGDRVLIYQGIKKAIIYRPSTNKIIEVAPINIESSSPPAGKVSGVSTAPTPTPKPLSIYLLNGTTNPNVVNNTEPRIRGIYPSAQFQRGTASKTDYATTQIFAMTDSARNQASEIARNIGGEVKTESPYGEDLTGRGDIVIIIGADKQ